MTGYDLLRQRLTTRTEPDLTPLIDARRHLLGRTWEQRPMWLREDGEAAVRRFIERVEAAGAANVDALDAAEDEIDAAFQELEQLLTRAADEG